MKKRLGLLVVGLTVVLLACGQLAHALAGPGADDPQDSLPAWSSDGVHLSLERTARGLQHVLATTSAGKDLFVASTTGVLRGAVPESPNLLVQSGSDTLVTPGGRFAPPPLVLHGTDASASPDGTHVAYLRGATLYSARLDGTGERTLAANVAPPSWDVVGPAWSPDGRQIAIASGSSLLLVQADGSGSRPLVTGANQSVNPSWSPDGATVAFERNAGAHWEIWTVGLAGTPAQVLISGSADFRYPQFSPVSRELAYISDVQHVPGEATPYRFALYLRPPAGSVHKLVDDVRPDSPPRWSPTAALVAVAAGQECRRWGIYVVRSSVGSRPHRISNICRFDGTAAADTIQGSPYFDLVRGLGGNDTIRAGAGNDRIEGDGGNDTIEAGAGNDVVFGGPGDDRIVGGPGDDLIIGGNGRDRIDCGAGSDTVEGAGPLDRIARDCEHVRR